MNGRSVRLLALAAVLLVGTLAAYSNHFDNPFHFDDLHSIRDNTYVRDIGNVPLFFTEPETRSTLPTNRAYRPMLMVTLALDYWLGDSLDPFYFHLSTFVWFLVQGLLMFFLYRRLLELSVEHRWNPFVALLIVGWYCLHTANAETINYVSARSDSLSTLCVVAGLVIHLYATSWKRHLAILPVLVGILIKSTAVMYFPLVVAYELLFVERLSFPELFRRRNRRAVGRVLLGVVPAAILSVSLFLFTLKMTPATWTPGGASNWAYLITQPFVIARYVLLVFLPTTLTADSDWVALAKIFDWRFGVGMLIVTGLLVLALVSSTTRSRRPIAFGIAWFLITLIPSSSVVPLAEVTNDHRLYYPYVGLCLAIGWAAALGLMRFEPALSRSGPLRLGVASILVAILGAHAYGTYQRSEVWGSDETLWHDVTIKSPNNGRGLMNYGLALMKRGDMESALSYYERALSTSFGRHPYLQLNLAIVKASLDRPDEEVEAHYHQAIRSGTTYPACHYWYANWLADRGRVEEALFHANRAHELSPGHDATIELVARLTGDAEVLLAEAEERAREEPTSDTLLQLSLEYYSAGRYADCIAAARRALEFDPDSAAAYNNICSAYNAQKMWDEGIAACDKALQIEPDHLLARNNRQWAINERSKSDAAQTE